MKITHLKKIGFTIAACAAILGGTYKSSAQPLDDTVDYLNSFDDAASVTSWIYWYGNGFNNGAMTWDATKDAATNANSGSLLFETTFPASDQGAWFGTFGNRWAYDTAGRHDATKYTNITVDIFVDPTSTLSQAGTFGDLQIGFYDGPNQIGSQTIPASATNGWVRIVQPINPAQENLSSVSGIAFRIQTYNNFANPVGPVKFWMDNIKMTVSTVNLPPPSLSTEITGASPGLNLFSLSSASEFQRTSVKVINQSGLGFNGQSNVTYSVTIKEFPDPTLYPNYQAHIFLTTGAGDNPALDYNEANLIWLNVQGNTNGGATAYFRYKIFEPGANTNLFGEEYVVGPVGSAWAGQLTNVVATTAIGTWSMTFNQDTNVTLKGPRGVSTSFTIRPEVAAQFVDPLNLVFGAQPNRPTEANPLGNVGQKVVLANVGATNEGTGTSIFFDNFLTDSTLNTTILSTLANAGNSVFVFPNDPGQKLVKWSLPDLGFYLERKADLGSGSWLPASPTASFAASGFRTALVPSSALNPNQNFFRLRKSEFSKLQILLPGETAAPGTPTGKIGTPTPQQVGVAFPIIVNAVDSNWVLMNTVTDQVSLSSSDPGFTWQGFPGTLIGGTITFDAESWQLAFGTAGSQTITASDVTDATKTSDTSSPVTVNP